MNATDWAALVIAAVTLITAFAGSVRWLVKHYLSELKPNGGASMADRLSSVETQVYKIYEILLEQQLSK
jgi:hypothetical protein